MAAVSLRITRGQAAQGIVLKTGEPHRVQLAAAAELLRLRGMFFDTNKTFLLPGTLDLLKSVKRIYETRPKTSLLVFGHTDTRGDAAVNDPLSLKRAEMIHAFLKDDKDAWLKQFDSGPESQRWGAHEDLLLISRAQGFASKPPQQSPIEWFQQTRSLTVDGIAGPQTRGQAIKEYMAVDETTLPASVDVLVIGCGADFPLQDDGVQLDAPPPDEKVDQLDRRVELFFYDPNAPDLPPKTREAYPQWLKLAPLLAEEDAGSSIRLLRLRLTEFGEPLTGLEFLVSTDTAVLAAGNVGANGLVEVLLPKGVENVTLKVPARRIVRTIRVRPPADFPAAETIKGAQVRLSQLGYFSGALDDVESLVLDDAVRRFRADQGLAASAARDGEFTTRLVSVYNG